GRLQHENGGRHLLIGWDIEVSSGDHLHSIGDPEAILKTVRQDHGHGNPSAWTIRLTVRPPRQYPKGWHDEDTILGDFLRAAENHRKADARELNLLPFTEEHVCSDATTGSGRSGLPSTATGLLTDIASSSRSEVLDQATLLGVELLRGGKPNWVRKP
ncbi:MAG: DNA repair exonuclease, partial [Planctomycetota bacterium]